MLLHSCSHIYKAFTDVWAFNFFFKEFIALNTAKLAATACTMVWNYLLYRKYVFINPVTKEAKVKQPRRVVFNLSLRRSFKRPLQA